MSFKPGDLVVQAKHWPDGYVFSVVTVDDVAGTVEALAVDPANTANPAMIPAYDDVHVEVNGTPVYDAQGNAVMRPGSEYDGDTPSGMAPVGVKTLNAATLAAYEGD